MITNAILNLAFKLANIIVSILPTSTGFSSEILSAAHSLGGYFGMFDPVAPIATVASCLGIVFFVEIAIFGWKTVKSLISHIPQFGGNGH